MDSPAIFRGHFLGDPEAVASPALAGMLGSPGMGKILGEDLPSVLDEDLNLTPGLIDSHIKHLSQLDEARLTENIEVSTVMVATNIFPSLPAYKACCFVVNNI